MIRQKILLSTINIAQRIGINTIFLYKKLLKIDDDTIIIDYPIELLEKEQIDIELVELE